MEEQNMTLKRLLREGAARLEQAGVSEAQLDARRLILAAFGMDEAHFLMERMKPLALSGPSPDSERAAEYRRMISARAEHVPLQYILGEQDFMGLTFAVSPQVLIPRQDTETLVELVLKERRDPGMRVLDLCTGSGCIAIALAAVGGYRDVTAADLSADALRVAEMNAKKLLGGRWKIEAPAVYEELGRNVSLAVPGESGTDVSLAVSGGAGKDALPAGCFRLLQGDLFAAIPPDARYDILVSNPPYIPTGVITGLQPEVRDHEPRLALDGSADGLAFYRRIAEEAPAHLAPEAAVYLEIGYDQAEPVRRLLARAGFENIEVFKDLPGLDRVVRAAYRHNAEL